VKAPLYKENLKSASTGTIACPQISVIAGVLVLSVLSVVNDIDKTYTQIKKL
jgi:hypothetical protein